MPSQNPKEFKTVCGDEIIDIKDHPFADYQGERVYFCGQGCLRSFEEDPNKYIASQNIPTINRG